MINQYKQLITGEAIENNLFWSELNIRQFLAEDELGRLAIREDLNLTIEETVEDLAIILTFANNYEERIDLINYVS